MHPLVRSSVLLALAALAAAGCGGQGGPGDVDGDGVTSDVDCDDANASIGAAVTWFVDADGDGFGFDGEETFESCEAQPGFVSLAGDCDDGNIRVNPHATERCDGVDNDCDGFSDEGTEAGVWYVDADGDGYGDVASATETCTPEDDLVAIGGDCDDGSAAVSPAADEVCNGVDDNCDRVTDADAVDRRFFHLDLDRDGYGTAFERVLACEAPSALYVGPDGDCDDFDAAISPGADEVCNGVDDNCDRDIDGGALDAVTVYFDGDGDGFGDAAEVLVTCEVPDGYVTDATDCDDADRALNPDTPWYGDGDGDGFGDPGAISRACTQPSGTVAMASDCDDGDADIAPGAVETCDGVDNNCDGRADGEDAVDASTWFLDFDGDGFGDPAITGTSCKAPRGFVDAGGDCDDDLAAVNPDADEVCDGVDNDCNNLADDEDSGTIDVPTLYLDEDGDGYGIDTDTVVACFEAGYAELDGDCEDADASINPGATEFCDGGIDNDCDGLVDLADPSNAGDGTWFADDDGDGYGDVDETTTGCSQPSGYVRNDEDCLDVAIAEGPGSGVDPEDVNPDSTEVCNNDIDDNCDGSANGCWFDDDRYDSSDADVIYNGQTTFDYLGSSLAAIGDIDDDGYPDFSVGAWGNDGRTSSAGRVYIIRGGQVEIDDDDEESANWMIDDIDDAFARIDGGASSDMLGRAMGPVGDLNGDGDADMAVAAPYAEQGSTFSTGIVYIFFGPLTSGDYDVDSDEDVAIAGQDSSDLLGEFTTFGDLDDDGIDDLVLGARYAETGSTFSQGEVYVFTGSRTFGPTGVSAAEFTVRGVDRNELAGSTARVADVDGDGAADLLVGAYGKSSYRGAVTVFTDTAAMSGGYTTDDYDWRFLGSGTSDFCAFGSPLSGSNGGLATADVNGDGYRDVAIGCYNGDGANNRTFSAGDVFIVYGGTSIDDADDLDNDADLVWHGQTSFRYLGQNMVNAGDTNGDGVDELVVAGANANSSRGEAWLVSLPTDETNTTINTFGEVLFTGSNVSDLFSGAIAPVGDMDGDGKEDLVFGSYGDDDNGSSSGSAFLFLGQGI